MQIYTYLSQQRTVPLSTSSLIAPLHTSCTYMYSYFSRHHIRNICQHCNKHNQACKQTGLHQNVQHKYNVCWVQLFTSKFQLQCQFVHCVIGLESIYSADIYLCSKAVVFQVTTVTSGINSVAIAIPYLPAHHSKARTTIKPDLILLRFQLYLWGSPFGVRFLCMCNFLIQLLRQSYSIFMDGACLVCFCCWHSPV